MPLNIVTKNTVIKTGAPYLNSKSLPIGNLNTLSNTSFLVHDSFYHFLSTDDIDGFHHKKEKVWVISDCTTDLVRFGGVGACFPLVLVFLLN